MPRWLCILLAVPLMACPTGDDDDSGDDDDATADPCEGVSGTSGTDVALTEWADGFSNPVHIANAGDGSDRLFVVEQGGTIVALDADGERLADPWLDIDARVRSGGEQGLLSVAFHPGFASNGRIFVYYTGSPDGRTVVSEFTVADPAAGAPDPDSERVLLEIDQPAGNHNGGQIAFGPDGYLYIGTGDGGNAGDFFGNGQNPQALLAKMLRIDVDSDSPYGIPADNPFAGDPQFRDEIWAWGLRNPWRFSFDRATGDLWIGDVGQGDREEINVSAPGANHGWPETEGTICYTSGCDVSAYDAPVWDYPRSQGISITGGFVYRGCQLPDLQGVYFFSDYNYVNSPLYSITYDGGASADEGPAFISGVGGIVSTFGEDEAGELYLAMHGQGEVHKIVAGGR